MILIALITLTILVGLIDGLMDRLQFHIHTLPEHIQKSNFWNPTTSWKNKWKQGDPQQGERFFLSSTALVSLTDGWHLLKEVKLQALSLVIGILLWCLGLGFIIPWLITRALIGLGFWVGYK